MYTEHPSNLNVLALNKVLQMNGLICADRVIAVHNDMTGVSCLLCFLSICFYFLVFLWYIFCLWGNGCKYYLDSVCKNFKVSNLIQ